MMREMSSRKAKENQKKELISGLIIEWILKPILEISGRRNGEIIMNPRKC
jgi:hypothetical protein